MYKRQLLLGACRKSPKPVERTADEGNLTIQLNFLGANLRVDDSDPISAVERLDLYFFSSEFDAAERTIVEHRIFSKEELATNEPLSISLPVASYYLVAVLNGTPIIQNKFAQGASWSKLFATNYTVSYTHLDVYKRQAPGPISIR